MSSRPHVPMPRPSPAELLAIRDVARFIEELARRLDLLQVQLPVNTALVYFHRFAAKHDLARYNVREVAGACLFLAAKVEETPKKIKYVVLAMLRILHGRHLPETAPEYAALKDRVLCMERVVLQSLEFEFRISHPFRPLVALIQAARSTGVLSSLETQVAQQAWNFVNDSFRTRIPLLFAPPTVAAAALILACKWSKLEAQTVHTALAIPDPMETLEEVMVHLLDMYEACKGAN